MARFRLSLITPPIVPTTPLSPSPQSTGQPGRSFPRVGSADRCFLTAIPRSSAWFEVMTIDATVTSVTPTRRCNLIEEHARRDGFAALTELHETLDTHYPGLVMDDSVDVVTFELT